MERWIFFTGGRGLFERKMCFMKEDISRKKNYLTIVAPDIAAALKIIKSLERTVFWHLVLWWWMVLFKESPPGIMVTRNPNWSTEILWFGTGYVKGKILSLLKRPAWGTLHRWFCFKLLKNFVGLYYDCLCGIFLTMTPVNIQLWIFQTLALVNIT